MLIFLVAGIEIPETKGLVNATSEQLLLIRGETDLPDPASVPLELAYYSAGLYIPEFNGIVVAARDKVFAVGVEEEDADGSLVPREEFRTALANCLFHASETSFVECVKELYI